MWKRLKVEGGTRGAAAGDPGWEHLGMGVRSCSERSDLARKDFACFLHQETPIHRAGGGGGGGKGGKEQEEKKKGGKRRRKRKKKKKEKEKEEKKKRRTKDEEEEEEEEEEKKKGRKRRRKRRKNEEEKEQEEEKKEEEKQKKEKEEQEQEKKEGKGRRGAGGEEGRKRKKRRRTRRRKERVEEEQEEKGGTRQCRNETGLGRPVQMMPPQLGFPRPRGFGLLCSDEQDIVFGLSSSEGFGVAEKILLLSFISAVILMAILGNLLVMVAVCRDRQLRKIKTNYFIVSLAFADLLVSVLVMPFGAIELVQDNWIYGEMFCLVRTSLDVLLTTASILHLCCISLDRYYAICCQPLVYRNKMTPLRIAVMLGGCWIIPTFISFLPIMQGWNSIGIIDLIQQRQFNKASNSTYCIFMVNKPYAITCSVVAFYIPFLLMVLAYHRIYEHPQESRQHPQEPRQHPPDQHSTHRMKTETKAAKTLCIIMGCFCLCWAPFFVTNIVDPFINYTVPGKLWTAFLWLGYINSGLNPFLYAFLNKAFRRAFLIILCCGDERYRRPSILGQTVPCSTTTINGSTHVLR
ncbi:hypothetical protein DUI87_26629 [Hirundo rustica rustica]|uniref:5-hydroxytryptamine receptor 4 n=1 Tax=Hirundo rustica rustica TaxID=333673 RepID=A0A3M0J6R3_HIRRU|nr:hypothetical protein DUI87_26629 [Hirundo rustica rustica]